MSPRLKNSLRDGLLLPAIGIVLFVGLWFIVSALTFEQPQYDRLVKQQAKAKTTVVEPWYAPSLFWRACKLPSPHRSWYEASKYLSAPFSENKDEGYRGIGLETLDSLALVAKGYLASLLIAVPIGFLLGGSKAFAKMFDPIMQVLRPVSPLAWFPLAGLLVVPMKTKLAASGVKIEALDWQCVFTIAICSVWPTIVNTAVGVRSIPQDYLNVARVLRLGTWKRFTKIQLPATLPYMFTGFRLSLGISWLVIVACEMLSGKAGIGFFLWNCYNGTPPNYGAMIASILVIGGVGFALDRLMTVLEKNVHTLLALPGVVCRAVVARIRPGESSGFEVVPAKES
ncbi:MAG: ABC transporter permease subunit [Tepidisphaeraceae bacterium]